MKKHLLEPFISSIPVSNEARQQLQQLQQSLGLREEIINVIEAQVTSSYEQKLKQYEEAFNRNIHQQYPLSDQAVQQLQSQHLEIKEEVRKKIEAKVTQVYKQKLQQYQEEFTKAIQQQYPLNQDSCHQLQRLQQELGLSNNIVALIEERITAPIEAERQQKLQQYEQAFTRAMQRQSLRDGELEPLSDGDREVLEHYQRRVLNLSKEITQAIEEQVTQAYKQNLQQYEEAFTSAIHQQYPLSDQVRQPLQLLQRKLELTPEITESIAVKVTSLYEQKLQQYESAVIWARQRQYPFSDEDHEFVEARRQKLSLSQKITDSIEAKVTETYKRTLPEPEEPAPKSSKCSLPQNETCLPLLPQPAGLKLITPVGVPGLRLKATTDSIEAKVTKTYKPILTPKEHVSGSSKRSLPQNETCLPLLLPGGLNSITPASAPKLWLIATVVAVVSVGAIAYYANIEQYAKAALAQTQALIARKNYQECANQVKGVPQISRFYSDARSLLIQCQHLAQDKKWLAQAKELEKKNKFKDAIATANKIKLYSSFHQEAQQLISQWSEKLLKLAEGQYQQSDKFAALQNAIELTTAIPKTSSVAKKAEEAIKKWRTEWNKNEHSLQEAQNALNEQKWQEAKLKANTIRLLGQEVKPDTPYWQNKIKPIIEIAEQRIAGSTSQKTAPKRQSSLIGPKLVGPKIVGSRLVGPRNIGTRLVGSRPVVSRNVGPRLVGSRPVGSRNVGPRNGVRQGGFRKESR